MNEKYKRLMEEKVKQIQGIIDTNSYIPVGDWKDSYQTGFTACHEEMQKDLREVVDYLWDEISYAYDDRSVEFCKLVKDKIDAKLKSMGVE